MDRNASRWRPGAADLVFLAVLGLALIGRRTGFLDDPGTFWHLRLGRDIVRTGAVPRVDTLTFSKAGAPWVDQSWAFDAGLAWVVDHWGWAGAVGLSAMLVAWVYSALARGLADDGATPMVAASVAVAAASVGSIHFLTRPHLFTFAGVLWTLRACRAYHERGGRIVWTIPPVIAAWANLHGGFLAGPLVVATALVGHVIAGPWDAARRRRLIGFAAVLGLSLAAPLVNPYGIGLYRHVVELLHGSGVTTLIDEYQPIPFGTSRGRVTEWIVLALVGLPAVSRGRPGRYDMLHALAWLHFALGSFRHAPLFAIAAAPVLACWLDGLFAPRAVATLPPRPLRLRMLATLGLLGLIAAGVPVGGLSPKIWPLDALPALGREPAAARLFHEQDWGGLIASECRPERRAFLDDRFELFGRAAVLEYLGALNGGPDWDRLDGRERFDLAWLRPERPLARRLAAEPGWSVVRRDGVSVLFRRAAAGRTLAAGGAR